MNVARWTPSPLAEREAAEAARTAARAERRTILAVAGLALSCPLGIALTQISALGVFGWLAPIGLIAAAVAALDRTVDRRRETQGDLWRQDAATIDELGAREGWLVELIVHAGDAPLGADRGMLWIEDGRLYFAGRRTSFGLTPDQTLFCEIVRPVPGLRHPIRLPLRATTPAGPAAISLRVVRPAKWQLRTHDDEIVRTLDRWRSPSGVTGGQFPPLDLDASAPSLGRIGFGIAAGVAYWTALCAVVAGFLLGDLPFMTLALGLAGVYYSEARMVSLRVAWRALGDRRKLERSVP